MSTLAASYCDGRSTRNTPVHVTLLDGDLQVTGEGVERRIAFGQITVDERLGRAPRKLRFPDGAFCEVRDLIALDSLLASTGHHDGRVDRLQRHLPFVIVSVVLVVSLAGAAYRWGLPWAAERAARRIPSAVNHTLSTQTLQILDGDWLKPSKLADDQQQALRTQFVALRLPEGGMPSSALLFRASPLLGANAFTLPDGTILVLDDLVTSLHDDPEVLAVLAHELGHAEGRHSLRLLLQTTALGAFWTFYAGDMSSLLVVAPTALVQAQYSRAFEREADAYAASLLRYNRMSPRLLADALETIAKSHPGSNGAGFLSTHPSTPERLQRLRAEPSAPAGQ